jgi:hypothetical protein
MAQEMMNHGEEMAQWHPGSASSERESLSRKAEIASREQLEQGKVVEKYRLLGSNSTVMMVSLDSGLSAIYKPASGEMAIEGLEAYEPGHYYKGELAARFVNEMLGASLVPPSILTEIEQEIGSLQSYIPETKSMYQLGLYPDVVKSIDATNPFYDALVQLKLFDYITWNCDRNFSNVLFDSDGKMWLIDNAISFNEGDQRNLSRLDGFEIAYEHGQPYVELANDAERLAQLRQQLLEFIDEAAVDACIARIKHLGRLLAEKDVLSKQDIMFYPALKADVDGQTTFTDEEIEAWIQEVSGQAAD